MSQHGPNDGCGELLWEHMSAEPGFDEELRQATTEIAEGRGVPFSAAPQPLDVERLAAALHDDWEANHDLPWRCMDDPEKREKHIAVYLPRAERLVARLESQEGSE